MSDLCSDSQHPALILVKMSKEHYEMSLEFNLFDYMIEKLTTKPGEA